MKKVTLLLTASFIAFVVLGMMSTASALTITPSTTPQWTYPLPVSDPIANPNSGDDIEAIVGSSDPDLIMLYKANVDSGEETDAPFYDNYGTIFSDPPDDPADATITWDDAGEPVISGTPLYLLVKDGNQEPLWYLFGLNISGAPSWDGQETIYVQGFWLNGGAISHVDIYGPTTSVPEPSTLLLLGAGLIGLGILGRRKFRR